jgi:hypothetical protein
LPARKVYYFFNFHSLKRHNNSNMQITSTSVINVRIKGETELETSIFWVDSADETYRHEHIRGWS